MFTFDDGEHQYASDNTPLVQRPGQMRGQMVPLLNGGVMQCVQTDDDGNPVIDETLILTWEMADAAFLPLAEAAFRANRAVMVAYPWRGSFLTFTGRFLPDGWSEEPAPAQCTRLTLKLRGVGV
ncbi:MAG TPA: hypothetical protein PLZ36_16530 [Armatimonadota bacterium]|nr:hypothetical protein [Armatimonadota bacterium]